MPRRLLPAPSRAPLAVWISVLALMSAIAPLATGDRGGVDRAGVDAVDPA
ncbi:hypothetical protein ACTXG6_26255 [Pseudonocardia sp. Cha107L01]